MFRKLVTGNYGREFPAQAAKRAPIMLFGHNSNVTLGSRTFHVQTEDRGEPHALIDTTVFYHGRVLHRRTNNYFDLLPMDPEREEALKMRVEEQHRSVIEEMRSGKLHLPTPPEPLTPDMWQRSAVLVGAVEETKLLLELTNAKSWLSGKSARLQIAVRKQDGSPASAARVSVEFEGSDGAPPLHGQTNSYGETVIEFEMPRITSPEAGLVISAENHGGKGQLRFALRARPRAASL
jgi:hypothetical protein